jgi:hypothetical protein
MSTRIYLCFLPVVLALFGASGAEAGHRLRPHPVYGYGAYFAGPGYLPPPPRYYPYVFAPVPLAEFELDQYYEERFDESYFEPVYEPPAKKAAPAKKKTAAVKPASPAAALSCEKAASVVGGYGFGDVKATDCSGKVYIFSARRDGKAYAIKLSAANGELTEVRKLQ